MITLATIWVVWVSLVTWQAPANVTSRPAIDIGPTDARAISFAKSVQLLAELHGP